MKETMTNEHEGIVRTAPQRAPTFAREFALFFAPASGIAAISLAFEPTHLVHVLVLAVEAVLLVFDRLAPPSMRVRFGDEAPGPGGYRTAPPAHDLQEMIAFVEDTCGATRLSRASSMTRAAVAAAIVVVAFASGHLVTAGMFLVVTVRSPNRVRRWLTRRRLRKVGFFDELAAYDASAHDCMEARRCSRRGPPSLLDTVMSPFE